MVRTDRSPASHKGRGNEQAPELERSRLAQVCRVQRHSRIADKRSPRNWWNSSRAWNTTDEDTSIMITASLHTKAEVQQAARAAVIAYRAGFHQEAAILWRACVSAYLEKIK